MATSVGHNLYVNGNGFVFDYYRGHTYNLNSTGTFILRELLEGTTPAEISRALENKYRISHRIAAGDIEDFLQQLSALDLFGSNGAQPHDSM